jgi:SNF2 family DNA or RNA helicase
MNWLSEAQRFAPTLNAMQFGAGDRQKTLDQLQPFDLLVCSYGLLQQEDVAEMLAKVQWQTIVLDEAQSIKNFATKRSQAAMNLQGGFKLLTTGTPIENHLGELWNLFRFINPGLLGSLDTFNERFATPIERYGDQEARTRLKKLIQPFLLRRTKNQVLQELPSRTEILLQVDLSREETAFYEALRREAIAKLSDSDATAGAKHLQVLAEIMRLRRACCNPRLVKPEIVLPSSKLQLFGEVLTELLENKHKALVFSQFVAHLHLIREYLDAQKITYQYLDGSTPAADRKKRVNAFQAGEGDVFLISLKAGGTGLNLTAADYVIHMDPWWNPAVEDQASDRAHRIGQQRPVTIYRLVAKNTIEEKIVDLHQQKRDLADSLLEGAEMSGKVSTDDLLRLISER